MEKKKLREFWEDCGTDCRNRILLDVSKKCKNSIETVRAWMLGYRRPKGLDREALFDYIKTNFQTEIIEEGGKQ